MLQCFFFIIYSHKILRDLSSNIIVRMLWEGNTEAQGSDDQSMAGAGPKARPVNL